MSHGRIMDDGGGVRVRSGGQGLCCGHVECSVLVREGAVSHFVLLFIVPDYVTNDYVVS